MSKNNKLDIYNRINLQCCISKGITLEETAKLLKCDRSTVYRELKNNCYYKSSRITCAHCLKSKNNTCDHKNNFLGPECIEFIPIPCPNWKKFPYTCNGCAKTHFCSNLRRFYDFEIADDMSVSKRVKSREKIKLKTAELKLVNSIVSRGVKLGQSIHHCYIANEELKTICSERTIRRLIYKNYFEVKCHELPRYTRFKHLKKYKRESGTRNIDRLFMRTFDVFLQFKEKNPSLHCWQFDSVEGKKTDKFAILTITNPETRFQFGILICKSNPRSVLSALTNLFKKIGDKFADIFQVNLADNGIEFDKLYEIENFINDCFVPKVFYTNAYRSTDKAACERNHEFIRYVIPKGKSLDFLNQDLVNLLFSHINSYIRSSNENQTPYALIKKKFGVEFLDQLGIKSIPTKDVNLKPDLIK